MFVESVQEGKGEVVRWLKEIMMCEKGKLKVGFVFRKELVF